MERTTHPMGRPSTWDLHVIGNNISLDTSHKTNKNHVPTPASWSIYHAWHGEKQPHISNHMNDCMPIRDDLLIC